jgi:hypothetical protein
MAKNKKTKDKPTVLGVVASDVSPIIAGTYNYFDAQSKGNKNAANAYGMVALVSGVLQLTGFIAYKKQNKQIT